MAQISKYPLSKKVADRIFEVFLKSLIEIHNKEDAEQFLTDFLTPTEKIVLAKRLAIAVLLEKGYDYNAIKQLIRVSAPTIASVNTQRKYGSNGYNKLITKLLQEEKLTEFFDETLNKLLSIPTTLERGQGTWSYLKQKHDAKRKKQKKAF